MCETVDVFAGNYTIIDWEIHELWLDGLSANEAISYLREGVVKDFGPNMISQDILSNARNIDTEGQNASVVPSSKFSKSSTLILENFTDT